MNKKNHSFLNPILTILLACSISTIAIGREVLSAHQDPPAKVDNQDPVYSEDEVDVKAEILNLADANPVRSGIDRDCKNNVEVQLTMVLRKSGKVSDVKIVKSAKCDLDIKAIQGVKRIKFKRAEKNGIAVSQLSNISFRYFREY